MDSLSDPQKAHGSFPVLTHSPVHPLVVLQYFQCCLLNHLALFTVNRRQRQRISERLCKACNDNRIVTSKIIQSDSLRDAVVFFTFTGCPDEDLLVVLRSML